MLTNSTKDIYNITKKRLKTPDEVKRYFPAGFLSFIDCT